MSASNPGFVDVGARTSSSPASSPACVGTSLPNPCDYPSLRSQRTQDVFQSIVKGRKNWKTLRGGEYVWPPELEAALLEGLESYQPDDSRETRLLGRFPMRNRFISEHIYRKTGKRRTAKQVGSRLQQLRDTCGGKRLLNLLSPYRRPPPRQRWPDASIQYDGVPPLRQDTESSSEGSSSAPNTPVDTHRRLLDSGGNVLNTMPETVVYIDLLPDGYTSPETHTEANPSGSTTPVDQPLANGNVVHASNPPRHFSSIDPTITFMAPSTLSARSHYTVYMNGTSVFSEATVLSQIGSPLEIERQGALLYSTSLVPGFWGILSKSVDPTQYTIVQHVVQEASTLVFSAVYKFRYPTRPSDTFPSPIPHMEPAPHDVDYSDFNSLLPMDYDFPSWEQKDDWGYCSPQSSSRDLYSHTSQSPSSERDEDSDSLLSPSTACFPMDLSNYVL